MSQEQYGQQRLKYLLAGSLQDKFANPRNRAWAVTGIPECPPPARPGARRGITVKEDTVRGFKELTLQAGPSNKVASPRVDYLSSPRAAQ